MLLKNKKRDIGTTCITLLDSRSDELCTKLHIHKEIQLLAGISGMLEVSIGTKKINLRVGDVIIINARTAHSVRAALPFTSTASIKLSPSFVVSKDHSEICNDLSESLLAEQKSYVYMRREDEETAEICAIITKMNDEMSKKEQSYSTFIEGYAKILLGMLVRHKKLNVKHVDNASIEKLAPVFKYVEDNYARDISLEDAADTLKMNREYFCRIFKKVTTLTFIDYLNAVRTKRAEDLLITTDKSISEIAGSTGFSSVSYFTRVFKNITNFTPASYSSQKNQKRLV